MLPKGDGTLSRVLAEQRAEDMGLSASAARTGVMSSELVVEVSSCEICRRIDLLSIHGLEGYAGIRIPLFSAALVSVSPTSSTQLRLCVVSSWLRSRWSPDVICDGVPAGDRVAWCVQNLLLSSEEARPRGTECTCSFLLILEHQSLYRTHQAASHAGVLYEFRREGWHHRCSLVCNV